MELGVPGTPPGTPMTIVEIRCLSRCAGRSGLGSHAKVTAERTHQSKLAWHHRRDRWEPTVAPFRGSNSRPYEAEFMCGPPFYLKEIP